MRIELGNHVPYLLGRAGMTLAHGFSRDLDRFGITLPMWRVMSVLLGEGEQRLGDLSRLTAIELSTLSRVAVSMETAGLVVRRRSGQDARAVLVSLTSDGRAKAVSIIPAALDWENTATAGMSDEEVCTLKGLLSRLYGNINSGDGLAVSP